MSSSLFFRLSTLLVLSPLSFAALDAPNTVQESGQTEKQETPSDATHGRVLKLTLEDAVRIALNQNIDLEVEKLSTEIVRHNTTGSWGAFDPLASLTLFGTDAESPRQNNAQGASVIKSSRDSINGSLKYPFTTGGDLTLTYDRQITSSNGGFFPNQTTDDLTLSLNQPLLRGAWKRYATTIQREQELTLLRQFSRESQVRADLIQSVFNAYWDLVSAIEETSVRTLAVQRGEKQLLQDKRRLDLGAGTEVDVLQSETNVAQQEEALLRAGFDQLSAEDTLRQLVFQDRQSLEDELALEEIEQERYLEKWDWAIEPLTQLPSLKNELYDWRVSFDRALMWRPELVQSRLDIDVAEVRHEDAYGNFLPQLDLNITTKRSGGSPDKDVSLKSAFSNDFPETSASLNFSIPLGNRTAKYALKAAEVSMRKARLDYSKQELVVLAEVRAAVRDVIFRAEAVNAASKSATLAERQEQAEHLRMEIGLSTTFQVLEFQGTLAEAKSALVLAQAAYAKALVGLDHAEGSLGISQD